MTSKKNKQKNNEELKVYGTIEENDEEMLNKNNVQSSASIELSYQKHDGKNYNELHKDG